MGNYSEDDELIELLRSPDERLEKDLYQGLRSAFVGKLMKDWNGDESRIVDVYQAAFTITIMNIRNRKLNPPMKASLQTYIIGVGKNLMLKNWQKDRLRAEVELNDDHKQLSIEEGHVERWMRQEHSARLITGLLSRMKDLCRETISLLYLEGMDPEAAAERLGISHGTLRKRKYDCLDRLRKMVKTRVP